MMKKGVELTLKLVFAGCIVLILIELKWIMQEQLFDGQAIDSYLEKGVTVGKKVLAQGAANGFILAREMKSTELW